MICTCLHWFICRPDHLLFGWAKSIFEWSKWVFGMVAFWGEKSCFNYVINFGLKMGVTLVYAWMMMWKGLDLEWFLWDIFRLAYIFIVHKILLVCCHHKWTPGRWLFISCTLDVGQFRKWFKYMDYCLFPVFSSHNLSFSCIISNATHNLRLNDIRFCRDVSIKY